MIQALNPSSAHRRLIHHISLFSTADSRLPSLFYTLRFPSQISSTPPGLIRILPIVPQTMTLCSLSSKTTLTGMHSLTLIQNLTILLFRLKISPSRKASLFALPPKTRPLCLPSQLPMVLQSHFAGRGRILCLPSTDNNEQYHHPKSNQEGDAIFSFFLPP
jgi:hypothetical protein